MNDDELITYCSRCGAEMKKSARYCLKCGNLNYDHPDNEKYKKFEKHSGSMFYRVGSKKSIEKVENGSLALGSKMGGKNLCFWVNMFAFLLVMVITIIIAVVKYSDSLLLIVYSNFPVIWLIICIYFLLFYGMELMFMKANKPWYGVFIPIYNLLLIAEMAMEKRIWALLFLVPFGPFYLNYKLGQRFGGRGIKTLIFGCIDYLVIGYSSSVLYDGYHYVDNLDLDNAEKDYGKKSITRKIIIFVFIASIGMFIASNFTSFMRTIDTASKELFVKQAERLVSKTEKSIEKGTYSCDSSTTRMLGNGTYYFVYNDTAEYGVGNHETFGYVKVIKNGDKLDMRVYITSDKMTIKEAKLENITSDVVIEEFGGDVVPNNGFYCTID